MKVGRRYHDRFTDGDEPIKNRVRMTKGTPTPPPDIEDPAVIRRETADVLKRFAARRESMIPILQAVQARLSYLPAAAMREIAAFLEIPEVDVYGVVTFYNQFRLIPPGRHSIRVCLGTACHMKGGYISLDAWKRRLEIESGETTEDREFDLGTVACVGCCTLAPVTVVDERPEAKVEPTRVDGILLAFENERLAAAAEAPCAEEAA